VLARGEVLPAAGGLAQGVRLAALPAPVVAGVLAGAACRARCTWPTTSQCVSIDFVAGEPLAGLRSGALSQVALPPAALGDSALVREACRPAASPLAVTRGGRCCGSVPAVRAPLRRRVSGGRLCTPVAARGRRAPDPAGGHARAARRAAGGRGRAGPALERALGRGGRRTALPGARARTCLPASLA